MLDFYLHCEMEGFNEGMAKTPLEGNNSNYQGPDFDDMSSFFPCEIDDAIQYINLGYGAQAPEIFIL